MLILHRVAGFVKHFIFSLKGLRVEIPGFIPVGEEGIGLFEKVCYDGLIRHACENGHPVIFWKFWIPSCAGMTAQGTTALEILKTDHLSSHASFAPHMPYDG
jgi:hypothetical protein